ncbi:MAG: hypothetical protein V4662_18990 [Verrucomicrobiota bacterium]
MKTSKPLAQENDRQGHWRGWLIGVGMMALICGGVVLFGPRVVEKKLETVDVRKRVSLHTAGELNMSAGFLPLDWQGLDVRSEGFWAKSEAPERAREIRAHGIKATSSLSQWQSHVIRVKALEVEHLELAFGAAAVEDLRDPFAHPPELLPAEAATGGGKWATEIEKLVIQRTNLLWGQERKSAGGLRDSLTEAQRVGDGQYRMQGTKGSLRQSGWPELKVRSFSGSYADQTLTIEKSDLRLGGEDEDTVSITGHICDSKEGGMRLQVNAKGCSVTPLLPKESRGKLTGDFTTQAEITREGGKATRDDEPNKKSAKAGDEHGDRKVATTKSEDKTRDIDKKNGGQKKKVAEDSGVATEVEGKITFSGAMVRQIAALGKAAEFTGIERFRRLDLDVLKGAYVWRNGELQVTDFVLEATGLLRVEGRFTLKNEIIDGTFDLGVSSAVLESFPGAAGVVFNRRGRGDYAWAKLRLSGNLEHPEEDLKPRLLAAAKAHYAKKFLAPILKPGKLVIKAIESLY